MNTSTALRPPRVPAPPPPRPGPERVLLALEVLLAVGAYVGAAGFFLALESMEPLRELLPFGSFVFAGVALAAVNGVLPTVVVVGAFRRAPWARDGHVAVGLALIGWIVVQVAVLGWPPALLQWAYLGYGVVLTVLALRVRSEAR